MALFSGSGDHPPPFRPSGRTRQRVLLLAPALLSLFFMAAAEYGRETTADAGTGGVVTAIKDKIVAALKDPLALLAERSPGGRIPGPLHLTKPNTGPHERVLAQVRERDPAPDLTPSGDDSVFAGDAPATTSFPGDLSQGSGLPPGIPASFNTPLGFPGIGAAAANPGGGGTLPGDPGNPSTPGGPTNTQPGGPGIPDPPPGDPGNPIGTPPGDPGTPGAPPGNPGGPIGGTPPPATEIPEPATWALMILGLLAAGATMRRQERKRAA